MPKLGMKEIRSAQLIEATIEVINEVGLSGASVAMIGKRAGVAPSIINHYFSGKSGLMEATMRHVMQQLSDQIQDQLRQIGDSNPTQRLLAIVYGNFAGAVNEPKYIKSWLAFWGQAMHDPILFRLQKINQKRLISNLRHEIKKLVNSERADAITQTLAALIDGLWLRGALSPTGIDPDSAVELITQYLKAEGLT